MSVANKFLNETLDPLIEREVIHQMKLNLKLQSSEFNSNQPVIGQIKKPSVPKLKKGQRFTKNSYSESRKNKHKFYIRRMIATY